MYRQNEKRVVPGLAGLAGLAAAGLLGTDARDARAETMGLNWYDTQTGIWKTDGPLDYPYVTGLNVAIMGTDILAASSGRGSTSSEILIKYSPIEQKIASYQVGTDPKTTRGLTIGTGDLDGDGIPDVVVGPASGLGSTLYQALNSPNGLQFEPLQKDAYDVGFKGGVNVAVIPADKGNGPRFVTAPVSGTPGTPTAIQVLSNSMAKLAVKLHPFSYAGWDDYDGGINTAVTEPDSSNIRRVVAEMYCEEVTLKYGPPVAMYDTEYTVKKYNRIALYDTDLTTVKADFTVDASGLLSIAAADFNGDGFSDIVVGAAVGDLPDIRIFMNDGTDKFELSKTLLAYDPGYRGGVNVAAGDVNGDGFVDIVTAPASAVPEPTTIAVIGAAAILGCSRRRRKPGYKRI